MLQDGSYLRLYLVWYLLVKSFMVVVQSCGLLLSLELFNDAGSTAYVI
jgi:hypothetical protein